MLPACKQRQTAAGRQAGEQRRAACWCGSGSPNRCIVPLSCVHFVSILLIMPTAARPALHSCLPCSACERQLRDMKQCLRRAALYPFDTRGVQR